MKSARARVSALAAATVLAIGCSSQPAPTPAPSSDFVERICDADVAAAVTRSRDANALDDAIRDCLTTDRLSATLARHPGALDPAVSDLPEFVERRCEDESADLDDTIICSNFPTAS
jgi:hypothetical protein